MVNVIARILRFLELLLKSRIFTMRTGLAKGLKRRYGFGFKPKLSLTEEEKFLMGLDFQGKTVFDGGGYVGIYAMFFARAVGKTGRVITFEPNPRNYEELAYNVRLNGFDNVTVMQIGLGRKQERLDLAIDPLYPSRGTVRKKGAKTVEIKVFPLDSLVKMGELPKPDFVKLDVEGSEMGVLYGMVETIGNYKPDLFIEIHGEIPEEMIELLTSNGYSIHHVESDTEIAPHHSPRIVGGHLFCE